MKRTIDERLSTYGRAACLICGQPKDDSYRDAVARESIFAGERYQLTCRNHPGHPLYSERGKHEAGLPHMEDKSKQAAARQSVIV